jgi:outer membrane receptor for ferrienterochelin and colicin
MFSKLSKIVLGITLIALVAGPAFASTQEGSMSGVVLDKGGNPLPGATVTVKGPAMQGEKMAVTDGEGRWRIPLVAVGQNYEVSAFIDGFQRVIQTDITVNIAANSRVDFTMVEGTGDLGEITVTAEAPLIDSKKTSISETITYEFMEDIPTGRSYFDAMSMAAGVAGFGNVFTHGADNTDNVFLVDGVDTTDNATGTFGMNFSYEAIQEVEMKTGAFEAEYGRATGAISNVVTKSGGNEFHGAIPIYYTNLDMKRHQEADRGAVDEEKFYEIEPGVSIGGPILRDRLWFFASYNNFTRRIEGINPFDEVIKRSEIFEEWMGKVTWQLNADNKIVGQYASDPASIDSRDSLSTTTMASAYGIQEQGGDLYKLQWTSIFTPNLFLEAKVAHHEVNLTIGPANAAWTDDRIQDQFDGNSTAITYGNVSSITNIHRPRDQYNAVLNYYLGDWAGEHNMKFGVEFQDYQYDEDAIYPNSFTINRPPNPATGEERPDQWLQQTPLLASNDGSILTAFVQDSWTYRDNWAINLGLRWETQKQNNDVGETVYKLDNLIAPRAGLSWDINGDGRSKAYANFGRYYDAVGSYLGQALNRQTNSTYRWEGTYDPNDPYNPDNWTLVNQTDGANNTTTIDPNLSANYKDEVVVGYEFEFATDFSAGAKFIWNWQRNLIEDVLANEDALRAGTETVNNYYITNVDQARRNYKGIELQLKKRLSNNYQFLLVYTLSEAKGSLANSGQAEGLNVYADFAEVLYNRYGYLPWDDRHYLKLNGSYHLPWGIILGTGMGWRSGRPYNRIASAMPDSVGGISGYSGQYYLDPRGSHRLGHVWWMDLRATKDFNIGDTELSVIVDAFNVWNSQFVLSRQSTDSELPTSTWGEANGWMGAGNFVVGLKYSF